MTQQLNRLLHPKTIAVVGGGAWAAQVIRQSEKMGFSGDIWPVHPKNDMVADHKAYATVSDLPADPDAVFIGVNRHATIDIVRDLSAMGAGGAVCFASGFSEAAAENAEGNDLQAQLVAAAGEMPIIGPNCYGFINALDGALLWPDQHGCTRVDCGVAILSQSSNIAINLSMLRRELPLAYVATVGNMAQTSQAEVAAALLDDPRVTAIGLHIEGFGDLRSWETLAQKANHKGIPLVALKVGASEQSQLATVSHTASLAGSDAGAQALLDRLGIPRVQSLPILAETLKLLHLQGSLPSGRIASISCSGGEASLIADLALNHALEFPKLTKAQKDNLRTVLGSMVALHNPLDYQTFIWRDAEAMTKAWSSMTGGEIDMTLSIVDYPTTDSVDWEATITAAINVHQQTGAAFGVVSTMPELMPLDVAARLSAAGVVPFMGLQEALAAIEAASQIRAPMDTPICLPGTDKATETLDEAAAKTALAAYGVPVPQSRLATRPEEVEEAVAELREPFAMKGVGLAHKTEHGAVRLGIAASEAVHVARDIATEQVLIEEMATGSIQELLIGVTRDDAHGFLLTIGAGGVLTEILRDTVSLLLPSPREAVAHALQKLRCAPVLNGYRGKPRVDQEALLDAIDCVQDYVLENATTLTEVEINPLICTAKEVVAVDALIRKS